MSEDPQYDSLLGGNQKLPSAINLMQFTAARSKEIQAMKHFLSFSKGAKLIFQKLPRHMRRRVMSHNAKRLPRRLREMHLNQLKKSGLSPKHKRPSRKYRRRSKKLLEDYARRQRKYKWLETHIWHAKRFHMVERWGYKLAESPCDKSFRACYRATAKHCLLQDISYISCLEITGNEDILINRLRSICDPNIGLSIGAKAYLSGNREGETTLFKYNVIPKEAIGTIYFNWKPLLCKNLRSLWIWVHAAYYDDILTTIIELFDLKENCEPNIEKYQNTENNITLSDLKYDLNRFRLAGPLSQAVLQKALRPINLNLPSLNSEWIGNYLDDERRQIITMQYEYWKSIENVSSPAHLSPHIIISLIATDPRYNFPKRRTKALTKNVHVDLKFVHEVPQNICAGPIWDENVRRQVKQSKISNAKIAELRSELLVPGTDLEELGAPVPYMLIQRPGNGDDKLGYCSGWDLIMPSGWAQATWITLVMWGARAGGLRETNSMSFEMGVPSILAPDTAAGKNEDKRLTDLCRYRYFSLPPNRRTNYNKLAIASPFSCNWNIIIGDWQNYSEPVENFFVLRDRVILREIQNALSSKGKGRPNLNIDYMSNCIIPIKLKLDKKGLPKRYAIICLPACNDLKNNITTKESLKSDEYQATRKELRDTHKVILKRLRKRRVRAKQSGKVVPIDTKMLKEYTDQMRQLWLPEPKRNIRQSCSREVIGFVTEGEFSFTVAHSAAVGYIAIGSLPALFSQVCKNKVLVRNTGSREYRRATLQIVI